TAAQLFLEHFGLTLPPGCWSAHSDLRVGVGMASSTADIVATLRCLFRLFALPYDTDVVLGILTAIERADSVFLDEFALYLSGRHRVIRRLGTDIGFHTAYITEPGTVDTAAVTDLLLEHYQRHGEEYDSCLKDLVKGFASGDLAADARAAPTDLLLEHYRRHGEEYERCLTDLLKGFASGDPAAVARAATASAALSQSVLPKATFDSMLAHRERFGADGIFVAHTGCLIGY